MGEGFKGTVFEHTSPCSVVRKSSGETEMVYHRLKGQFTHQMANLVARKYFRIDRKNSSMVKGTVYILVGPCRKVTNPSRKGRRALH
jgi:hypothetical protein